MATEGPDPARPAWRRYWWLLTASWKELDRNLTLTRGEKWRLATGRTWFHISVFMVLFLVLLGIAGMCAPRLAQAAPLAASTTLNLPAPSSGGGGSEIVWDNLSLTVPSGFVSGGATAYLRYVRISSTQLEIRLASTSSGDASQAGPNFTSSLLGNGTVTVTRSSYSFEVMQNQYGDTSEPYVWSFNSGGGASTPTDAANFVTNFPTAGTGTTLQLDDGQTGSNTAPTISSFTVPTSPVIGGQSYSIAVVASDTDADPLTYSWTASAGTIASASSASTSWTAPATQSNAQTVTITVTVNDGTVNVTRNGTVTVSGSGGGGGQTSNVLYAMGNRTLYTVDRATGAATEVGGLIGASLYASRDLTWDGATLFMASELGQNRRLYTVDRTMGTAIEVGPFGGGVLFPRGLAWDGSALWLLAAGKLYTVDRATGATTEVGSLGFNVSWQGLAWDGATLYVSDTTFNKLYAVNRTTGAATEVGPFGLDANLGRLAWDGATLWMVNSVSSDSRLYAVNRTTGAATEVGSLGASAGNGGLAWAPAGNPQCTESLVVDLTTLDGYQHDFGATADTCWVNPDVADTPRAVANVYRFELSESRAVAFRFVPTTDFESGDSGGYKLRLRSGSLSGQVVQETDGDGTLNLSGVQIGADLPYVLEVMRYGSGGGTQWSASLSYAFISPPTPTPLPSPTPRVLAGDFRLVPNPSGLRYQATQTYSFHPEGGPDDIYPVTLRFANSSAAGWGNCSTAERTATRGQALSMTACTAGQNSQLLVLRGDDLSEVISYNVYVQGQGVSQPALPAAEEAIGATGDALGFRLLLDEVCTGAGIQCDADLSVVLLVFGLMMGMSTVALHRNRGAATAMGVGSALGLGLATLMWGYMVLEFPLWIVIVVMLLILSSGAFAFWRVMKSTGA